MSRKIIYGGLCAALLFICSTVDFFQEPTIYIIGDSTVRNFNEAQRGWGTFLSLYLDSTKVHVEGAFFIDLNNITADKYDKIGQEQ